jgi:hypothetical protein
VLASMSWACEVGISQHGLFRRIVSSFNFTARIIFWKCRSGTVLIFN